MSDDPLAGSGRPDVTHDRRVRAIVAGHRGDTTTALALLGDPEGTVRAAALGALFRSGRATAEQVVACLGDPSPVVRRRACQVAAEMATGAAGETVAGEMAGREAPGELPGGDTGGDTDGVAGTPAGLDALRAALRDALGDEDALVAEHACWALGEHADLDAVDPLSEVAGTHDDARCREAAVAALGAIGDPAGLPAVLGRLDDRPPVRRRAVVALAAFEGPEVDEALERCLSDRDWQVRQAAEELTGVGSDGPGGLGTPRASGAPSASGAPDGAD